MEARKEGDSNRVEVLKLIKAKLLEYNTQPKAPELTEQVCNNILNKMIKELKNDLSVAIDNNRPVLIKEIQYQIDTISTFLPKEATEEEINSFLDTIIPDGIAQKEMSLIVNKVKQHFASVNGGTVAKLVKARIK